MRLVRLAAENWVNSCLLGVGFLALLKDGMTNHYQMFSSVLLFVSSPGTLAVRMQPGRFGIRGRVETRALCVTLR